MRRRFFHVVTLVAVGASFAGCGAPPEGPRLNLDFSVSAALADTLAAFQVSVATNSTTIDCSQVATTCAKAAMPALTFLNVIDADGKSVRGARFPVALTGANPATQAVTLRGIQPGTKYAIIIEALTKDDPPRLAGSSCNFVGEIVAGTNAELLAAPIAPFAAPKACDPRLDP